MVPWVAQPALLLPLLATSFLSTAAVAAAMLALRVHSESRLPDLELLHREVDEVRGLLLEARRRGEDLEPHEARLRRLQRLLPPDDLRRL
jgi:hypothetical protein